MSNKVVESSGSKDNLILKRRERDSNSRVQGTVDFESTAIPGYAISACWLRLMRAGHKSDAVGIQHARGRAQPRSERRAGHR